MRISLELLPAEGDRLQGHVVTEDGLIDLTFSGTLDLLRALEELRHARYDAVDADCAYPAASHFEGEIPSC